MFSLQQNVCILGLTFNSISLIRPLDETERKRFEELHTSIAVCPIAILY